MSVPRAISATDMNQFTPFIVPILVQAGFDAEDQEIFLAYLYSGGTPDVTAIALKFSSTEAIVEAHVKKLYDQISSHPLAQNIAKLHQKMRPMGTWEPAETSP